MSKGVKLEHSGKDLEAYLYLIDMKNFDIILGMEWLSRNHTIFKCHEREALFQKP